MRFAAHYQNCCALFAALFVSACESGTKLKDYLGPNVTAATYRDTPDTNHQSAKRYNGPVGRSELENSQAGEFRGSEQKGSGRYTAPIEQVVVEKTNAGKDGVTLNLVNVSIVQAAKSILGDALGLNYTVSDKVAGSITVQTSSPMQKEALIDVFESALKVSGATIVSSNGTYSVLPSTSLSSLGQSIRARKDDDVGNQIRIVSLRYVSASEMRRIVEPIVAQGAILRVDDARSLLVVSGTARELGDMDDLVRVFDADWMKGRSVGLYPVSSSDPEAIATELETVMGLDKDGPLRGAIRVIPNRRLGAVLVTSAKPQYLDTARNWIQKLERAALQSEPQLYVYKIQNRRAAELAAILQSILGSGTAGDATFSNGIAPRYEAQEIATSSNVDDISLRGAPSSLTNNVSTSASNGPNNGRASQQAQPTIPQTSLSSGRDQSASAAENTIFRTNKAKIVADAANNALLIEAAPKEYKRIQRILERIDVIPTQVMLEAVIAEVSLNDELRFGLKWYFESKPSRFTFSDALNGAVGSAFPGFSYFFSAASTKIALDALSDVTDVNVVSAPSLMVMDNRKAILQIGDQVPIITQTAQSVTNPDSPVINAVEMKDTGVILSVTPHVNDSGKVVLDVEQEVSNVTKTTSSGIDSPTIQQRKVKTTVVVGDGSVIALGGLIQQRDESGKTQVPVLGNIPVIGTVFRTKDDLLKKTELVIFIRPQVARNQNEAHDITEEYRSRINLKPLMETQGNDHYHRDADRILR